MFIYVNVWVCVRVQLCVCAKLNFNILGHKNSRNLNNKQNYRIIFNIFSSHVCITLLVIFYYIFCSSLSVSLYTLLSVYICIYIYIFIYGMQMLFRCVHFNCLVGLALISLSQLFNKFILQSVRFSHALNYEQEKNIIYFPLYILFFHTWVPMACHLKRIIALTAGYLSISFCIKIQTDTL